jgi:hypothetical protein
MRGIHLKGMRGKSNVGQRDYFIFIEHCVRRPPGFLRLRCSCCEAPFLTRGRVCNLLVQFSVALRLLSQLRPPQEKGSPALTTRGPTAEVL